MIYYIRVQYWFVISNTLIIILSNPLMMKKSYFLVATLFLAAVIKINAAEIKINVKPFKNYQQNEYALCIQKFSESAGFYSPYDTMYINSDGKFHIKELQPGRYSYAVMHPSSEIFLSTIQLINDESVVDMNIELDKVAITNKIDSVRIVGDFNHFNHWQNYKLLTYDDKSNYWYINTGDTEIGEFYFILNRNEKTHTPELPVSPKKGPWADFHNELNEGTTKLIFDPALLSQEQAQPKVSFNGEEAKFQMLFYTVDKILNEIEVFYNETSDTNDLATYKSFFKQQFDRIKELKEQNKEFNWVFPHYEIKLYDFHPITKEMYFAYINENKTLFKELHTGREYESIMHDKAKILAGLDSNILPITPRVIQEVDAFGKYYANQYDVYDEFNIPHGFYNQYLNDILTNTDDDEISGEILYLKAKSYSREKPEKAIAILNEILVKHPEYSGNNNGKIDKELKVLSINIGSPAPDFEVVTLKGEKISLSSLKGKYVFLDFWGSWCGPCRSEIPHINKMHNSIPQEEFIIIGLVCNDRREKVLDFIKENDIEYSNAMASHKLTADYGVQSFPTTFLIDKNGVIIAKNLRGEFLELQVRSKMK